VTPLKFRDFLQTPIRQPLIMGILNVTPDSFSDGGQFLSVPAAVLAARSMVDAGADLIDIGAESTRPGAVPVPAIEQCRRLIPVVQALRSLGGLTISIDTTSSEVARACLDEGAHMVNDTSAGMNDAQMLPLIADRKVPVVLMHNQGSPATLEAPPAYSDVVAEVKRFLRERLDAARQAGCADEQIIVDPGIGFGKTTAHNIQLLERLSEITTLGRPVLLGTSRKRFIGEITHTDAPVDRVFGTAATIAWGVANGADILRVHDVGPMKQVVQMICAIQFSRKNGFAGGERGL